MTIEEVKQRLARLEEMKKRKVHPSTILIAKNQLYKDALDAIVRWNLQGDSSAENDLARWVLEAEHILDDEDE